MNTFLEFLKNHKFTVLFVLIGLLLTILFLSKFCRDPLRFTTRMG